MNSCRLKEVGFKFKLQKVLDVRKTYKDLAERDFQAAAADVAVAERELSEMFEQKSQAHRVRGNLMTPGEPIAPQGFQQVHLFLVGQDLKIERCKDRISKLQEVAEAKRVILAEKAMDLKMLEKLKEKKTIEFQSERERISQREMDDLMIMRFRKRES